MNRNIKKQLQLGPPGNNEDELKPPKGPIFIIAPTGKSGTNLLLNILVAHNLARLPIDGPLAREDYLLYHSDLLTEYVQKTTLLWAKWKESKDTLPETSSRLLQCIGNGLLSFFGPPDKLPPVVKTPATRNLRVATTLFPTATFLLIVRDGRDVTESGMLSSYWRRHEEAFEAWAEGVRELLAFTQGLGLGACGRNWALLRFEGLVQAPIDELRSTIELLGAQPDAIDLDLIRRLPVYGSSDYGRMAGNAFQWCVAARTESFQPIGRWFNWSSSTKELFKKIAGNELIKLGYERDFSW